MLRVLTRSLHQSAVTASRARRRAAILGGAKPVSQGPVDPIDCDAPPLSSDGPPLRLDVDSDDGNDYDFVPLTDDTMVDEDKVSAECRLIANTLKDNRAQDVTCFIPYRQTVAQRMVFATALTANHIPSLALAIKRKFADHSGTTQGIRIHDRNSEDWAIIECNTTLVQIFSEDARDFYQMEKLWLMGREHDDVTLAALKVREEFLELNPLKQRRRKTSLKSYKLK